MKTLPIVFVLFLCACTQHKYDDYAKYIENSEPLNVFSERLFVNIKGDEPISLRGTYDNNNTIESNQILYAGTAGLGGFVAQVMTHSAINSSMKSGKLSLQQAEANQILKPFENILLKYTQESLRHDGYGYQFLASEPTEDGFIIDSYPVFYMSQNMASLTLKHVVKVYRFEDEGVFYQNVIEVISPTIESEDIAHDLVENDGALLKNTLSNLYKNSLSMVVADLMGEYKSSNSIQKSYRIHSGDNMRVERGINVSENNGMLVIKNLRGWLVAFPYNANNEVP